MRIQDIANNIETSKQYYQQIQVHQEHQNNLENKQDFNSQEQYSLSKAFMIGFLYFFQGIIISLPITMPFVYQNLPNYSTLSLFSLSLIPFSSKFLTAPLVQKYSFLNYGKRKTSIVGSQIFMIIAILCASFYTNQESAHILAFILLFMILFLTLHDISLHVLNVKQLKPTLAALMQGVFEGTGAIIGSLGLLKLTSLEFSKRILGLNEPITNATVIFRVLAITLLVTLILIHFLFKQTVLESEIIMNDKSLCQTISYYKIFFDTRSKHFRIIIIFLFFVQGFIAFEAGYDYELIKAGFSRDTLNTISNIISIPIHFLMCPFAPIFRKIGIGRSLIISIILLQLLFIYLYIAFPTDVSTITITSALTSFLISCRFIITTLMINDFPIIGVSGMFITMMASMANFGRNSALHKKLIEIFSWRKVALIGLVLQILLIIGFPFYYKWYVEGDVGIEGEIVDDKKQNKEGALQQHKC